MPIAIVNDITNFCFRCLLKPYTEAFARSKAKFLMSLTITVISICNSYRKESQVSYTKAFFFDAQHNIFQIKKEIFLYKPYISHFIKFSDCILILFYVNTNFKSSGKVYFLKNGMNLWGFEVINI